MERNAIQRDSLRVLLFLDLDAVGIVGPHLMQRQDMRRDQAQQYQRYGNYVECKETVQRGIAHHIIATYPQ